MVLASQNNNATINIDQLNKDIQLFPQVHPITEDMKLTHKGVSRLVMIDRYSFKDTEKTLASIGFAPGRLVMRRGEVWWASLPEPTGSGPSSRLQSWSSRLTSLTRAVFVRSL